uniref:Uncharacterized protein n=1 Tax=Oryza sativa subsp. japonica TaxID=39947 RepID=Q7EYN6_ORYSJ|nr:hypothetical protein [Oryza sativa Japonica Group]
MRRQVGHATARSGAAGRAAPARHSGEAAKWCGGQAARQLGGQAMWQRGGLQGAAARLFTGCRTCDDVRRATTRPCGGAAGGHRRGRGRATVARRGPARTGRWWRDPAGVVAGRQLPVPMRAAWRLGSGATTVQWCGCMASWPRRDHGATVRLGVPSARACGRTRRRRGCAAGRVAGAGARPARVWACADCDLHQSAYAGDSESAVVDFIGNGKNGTSVERGFQFCNSFKEIQRDQRVLYLLLHVSVNVVLITIANRDPESGTKDSNATWLVLPSIVPIVVINRD